VTDSSNNVLRTKSWQYDPEGNCTQSTDGAFTTLYGYDALGQCTSMKDPDGYTTSYDGPGANAVDDALRTSLSATINGTRDFLDNYFYDGNGNLNEIVRQGQAGGNGVTPEQVNFGYDPGNDLASINRYQGSHLVATSSYTYDGCRDLLTLTDTQGASTLAAYTWSYDPVGRVTSELSSGDSATPGGSATVSYGYDNDGQLKSASYSNFAHAPGNENYSFDNNGNQTGGTRQVGNDNEVTFDGTYTYQYDADGNETARWIAGTTGETHPGTNSGDYQITTYTWDDRNRLMEVDSYTTAAQYNAQTPTQTVKDTYDVENRLIGETVTTYNTNGSVNQSTQQQFVYDGNEIVLQFSRTTQGAVGTGALGNAGEEKVASNKSRQDIWAQAKLWLDERRTCW
jgi:YD repeat-containing protein